MTNIPQYLILMELERRQAEYLSKMPQDELEKLAIVSEPQAIETAIGPGFEPIRRRGGGGKVEEGSGVKKSYTSNKDGTNLKSLDTCKECDFIGIHNGNCSQYQVV